MKDRTLKKTAEEIYTKVMEKDLSPQEALPLLTRTGDGEYLFLAGRNWPVSIPSAMDPAILDPLFSALVLSGDPIRLYQAGLFWPRFDFTKAIPAVIATRNPEAIYRAGRAWPRFDTVSAISMLEKIGAARQIYYAGNDWRNFDFSSGQSALSRLMSGEYLFYAGCHWRTFDFQKGMTALLATGQLRFLFQAGCRWRTFDHAAAWNFFEQKVEEGSRWRAMAIEEKRWRKALHRYWQTLTGTLSATKEDAKAPHRTGGPGKWEIEMVPAALLSRQQKE